MKRYEVTYSTWSSGCYCKHRIVKAENQYEASEKFWRMMEKLNTNMGSLEIFKIEEL